MKIGIFGPSSACAPEAYQKARSQAQKLGYQLAEGNNPSLYYGDKRYLFSCDSAESRLHSLRKLLSDPEVNLIHSARGGYGSFELLAAISEIRNELCARPPGRHVYFAGMSDVTALLMLFDNVPNICPVHGPGFVDAFSDYETCNDRRQSADYLAQIVSEQWKGYRGLSLTCISSAMLSESDFVTGRVLGGNLTVLSALTGTPYMPDLSGRILFLEETAEKPYRVHRALSQLSFSGALDNLKAVILGDFSSCVHEKGLGPSVDDVLKEFFSEFNIPVLKGLPAGHVRLNMSIPMGARLAIGLSCIKTDT